MCSYLLKSLDKIIHISAKQFHNNNVDIMHLKLLYIKLKKNYIRDTIFWWENIEIYQ